MIPLSPSMRSRIDSDAFKLLVICIALVVAAAGGAYLMADHKDAVIAKMKTERAESEAAVAEASAERLQSAQARGNDLTNKLAKADEAREKTAKEHEREIKRLTSGRTCLSAGAVRLLNATAQGNNAPALPDATGVAAAENGAVATDTDVAGWADNARRQYDTCRDRLDALIDFSTGVKGDL